VRGEIQLPDKTVCITFDDGHKSNYQYVFPILKKYNLKATIFLITGQTTKSTVPFNPNILQYMSQDEVKK
jgi:peptidoglycan/xylan/chitin deacetylase (PgdA/CDA1 family)